MSSRRRAVIWVAAAIALFGVPTPGAPDEERLTVTAAPRARPRPAPEAAAAATTAVQPEEQPGASGLTRRSSARASTAEPPPSPSPPATVPPPAEPIATEPPPEPPPTGSGSSTTWEPYKDISVLVTTDAASYVEGEPVRITVQVCNTGRGAVRFQVYEGQEVVVAVLDDSGEGVAGGGGDGGDFRWQTWDAGQCYEYGEFLWWHERHHMGDQPGDGYPRAPAGGYRAWAEFTGQPERDPTTRPPDNGPRGTSDRFELDGVTVKVSTNKTRYATGEDVVVTAQVCNPSDRVHTQTFWWAPEAEIRIDRDGHYIAGNHVDGPTDEYSRTFLPRQCIDYRYVWNDAGPRGTYDVNVLWWGHSRRDLSEEDRLWWYSADTVFFDVA